jgi:hypothetical protein
MVGENLNSSMRRHTRSAQNSSRPPVKCVTVSTGAGNLGLSRQCPDTRQLYRWRRRPPRLQATNVRQERRQSGLKGMAKAAKLAPGFGDETGQTFQCNGGRIDFTDWRLLEFRFMGRTPHLFLIGAEQTTA